MSTNPVSGSDTTVDLATLLTTPLERGKACVECRRKKQVGNLFYFRPLEQVLLEFPDGSLITGTDCVFDRDLLLFHRSFATRSISSSSNMRHVAGHVLALCRSATACDPAAGAASVRIGPAVTKGSQQGRYQLSYRNALASSRPSFRLSSGDKKPRLPLLSLVSLNRRSVPVMLRVLLDRVVVSRFVVLEPSFICYQVSDSHHARSSYLLIRL